MMLHPTIESDRVFEEPHVAIGRRDINDPTREASPALGLDHLNGRLPAKDARPIHVRPIATMNDDADEGGEVRRQPGQERDDRLNPPADAPMTITSRVLAVALLRSLTTGE